MGDVLAIAEQRDGKIRPVANEVVTAAAMVAEGLGGSAHALVLGGAGVGEHAGDLGGFGADVVRVGEDPALEGFVPETHAAVIAEAVGSHGYAAVLFAATALGKDLAPRVAALIDAPLASDVTGLEVDGGRLVGTGGTVTDTYPTWPTLPLLAWLENVLLPQPTPWNFPEE